MNILCDSCGDIIEPWLIKMLLDGERIFGPSINRECFECFYIKNPLGSEPEWCNYLDEVGALDFLKEKL